MNILQRLCSSESDVLWTINYPLICIMKIFFRGGNYKLYELVLRTSAKKIYLSDTFSDLSSLTHLA